jgi:phosphohistidine phosphatase
MDLFLIRHAEAQPARGDAADDESRPLTDAGRESCRRLAQALVRLGVRLDRVLTSPLLRARQTAEGLVEHWPEPRPAVEICDALAPEGKSRKVARALLKLGDGAVALVGHMPDLAEHAAWLIGSKKASLDIAKAGAARVACGKAPDKGGGSLVWLVTPDWYDTTSGS